MTIQKEKKWRTDMAQMFSGRDDISPQELRELNLYGPGTFARGVWRDKSRTGVLSGDTNGIAVSVLHLGKQYENDLSDDGIIYHFPNNRTISQDRADIKSLENACNAGVRVGVISHGKTQKYRRIQFGLITDLSKDRCLILFDTVGENQPVEPSMSDFKLNASRREKSKNYERRLRDPLFRYWVEKRCGIKCAFCHIDHPGLLEAAHIKSVSAGGSDHPLNGLMLCANHHKALDSWLVTIEPNTGKILTSGSISPEPIGIVREHIQTRVFPANEAVVWHHSQWKRRHGQ